MKSVKHFSLTCGFLLLSVPLVYAAANPQAIKALKMKKAQQEMLEQQMANQQAQQSIDGAPDQSGSHTLSQAANQPTQEQIQEQNSNAQETQSQPIANSEAAAPQPPLPQQQTLVAAPTASALNNSEEASASTVIESFKTSSATWNNLPNEQVKEEIVAFFIKAIQTSGATITKPAAHYVSLIDGMSAQDPQMLANPMDKIIEISAILEYDFNNGQNKDDLAKKILGNGEGFLKNKQRLGIQ